MEEQYRGYYTYDGKFAGNILVVGRTGCGKTIFIQKLGKNKLFGNDLIEVFWVSKIVLSKEREDNIRDSFEDQEVHFSYPHDLDDFNYLVENFMQNKSDYIDNEEGEELSVTRLIVMDDMSGLADKSEEFSNFLTFSRKCGFSCLYIFHTIYQGRQSWEIIMSQTHIFDFFPGSIHSSRILKTLSLFASRQKNTYLPKQRIWLNSLYFQISNSVGKKCLTIDTREVNELGPGKFRTSAGNGQEQTCYFNRNKSDSRFTSYTSKRVLPEEKLHFSIVKVNSDFNLVNKSLEIEIKTNLFLNEQLKREHKQANRENFNNGRKNSTEGRRNSGLYTSDVSNPTISQRRRDGGDRDESSTGEQSTIALQKKPKFISSS